MSWLFVVANAHCMCYHRLVMSNRSIEWREVIFGKFDRYGASAHCRRTTYLSTWAEPYTHRTHSKTRMKCKTQQRIHRILFLRFISLFFNDIVCRWCSTYDSFSTFSFVSFISSFFLVKCHSRNSVVLCGLQSPHRKFRCRKNVILFGERASETNWINVISIVAEFSNQLLNFLLLYCLCHSHPDSCSYRDAGIFLIWATKTIWKELEKELHATAIYFKPHFEPHKFPAAVKKKKEKKNKMNNGNLHWILFGSPIHL